MKFPSHRSLFPGILLLLSMVSTHISPATAAASAAEGGRMPQIYRQFDINIPGVVEEMLDRDFWISRVNDPDKVIMSPAEINRYNRMSLRECEILKNLRTYRRLLTGSEIRKMVTKVSSRPSKKRFISGKEVGDDFYAALEKALDLDNIPRTVPVRFGITVKRTEMRSFPTFDRVFSEQDDYEFDMFMETAIYPVEPLAILHQSSDGEWLFVQTYNYMAWVPAVDVAFIDRSELFSCLDSEDFLVVTGKQVFTAYNPIHPEISELQLEMGARIPLAKRDEIPMEIDGQHPAGSYVVKLPTRGTPEGRVEWRLGLISRADDVRVGFLPLTRRNIITQAFKFLGQRYGWGGMFNTRDCSAFILDNFRSMGLQLPRNAGEQGRQAVGIRHDMPPDMDIEAKKKVFDSLPPATPIYMDGHAMLYLGREGRDYFIIHDFAGFSVPDEKGVMKRSKTRVVFVTPLLAIFLSSGKPWMAGIYSAREFVIAPGTGK